MNGIASRPSRTDAVLPTPTVGNPNDADARSGNNATSARTELRNQPPPTDSRLPPTIAPSSSSPPPPSDEHPSSSSSRQGRDDAMNVCCPTDVVPHDDDDQRSSDSKHSHAAGTVSTTPPSPDLSATQHPVDNERQNSAHSNLHHDHHDRDHHRHRHHLRVKKLFRKIAHSHLVANIGRFFHHAPHSLHDHRHPAATATATATATVANSAKTNKPDNERPSHQQQHSSRRALSSRRLKHRVDTLLYNCDTLEQHWDRVYYTIDRSKSLHGQDGLRQLGFEYRSVPITSSMISDEDNHDHDHDDSSSASSNSNNSNNCNNCNNSKTEHHDGSVDNDDTDDDNDDPHRGHPHYHRSASASIRHSYLHSLFMTRLFHIETDTMIDTHNRKRFIADGDMYDAIARLCQQAAQDVMQREGNLEWVVVAEAGNNPEPIRALVSAPIADHRQQALDKRSTLLIATGRGKVRAGIFSRQHLMASGMECSTALPIVREAVKRDMNVVMLDPNVHGERMGMSTFRESMSKLFRQWEDGSGNDSGNGNNSDDSNENDDASSDHPIGSETASNVRYHDRSRSSRMNTPVDHSDQGTIASSASPQRSFGGRDLFVLSHSQSGAQLARYLLDKSEHYLPHIRAIAFTDSTHNIQWTRKQEGLHRLLQSDRCVYYRSAKDVDGDTGNGFSLDKCDNDNAVKGIDVPLDSVGDDVDTDHFWKHRFGDITTKCAGTTEHSLTNWFARAQIWSHFDEYLRHSPNSDVGQ